MKYILNTEGEPVPTENIHEWAKHFEDNRRVASDHIGDIWISTVFLGMSPGHIWETMAFDKHHEEVDVLTCGGSRANALAMHKSMIASIEAALTIWNDE